jgi:hypothetical protein
MFQNNKIYKNLVCVRQIEINLNSDNSLSRLLKNINNKNKKQKINEQWLPQFKISVSNILHLKSHKINQ